MINKYPSVVLAIAALTGFGQPLLADQDRHQKKEGGREKHAVVAKAKHENVSRVNVAENRGVAASTHQRTIVRNTTRVPEMQSTSSSVAQRSVVRERTRAPQTRYAPTVALGGSQFRGTRFETRDRWSDSRDRSEV